MKTTDIAKPITAKSLNENLYKQYNVKINFDKYTREELEDARNKYRSKLFTQESQANFNDLLNNESYQRDKFVLDVLNTRIKEMLGESIASKIAIMEKAVKAKKAAKPDFLDVNKTGNKKEPFKKAVADKKKVKEAYDDDDDADVNRADAELKRMKKKPIKAANIDPDKDKIKRTRRDRKEEDDEIDEGYDSREAYDKWDPKHPDFVKNWKKFKANNPGATTAEYVAHLRKQPSKIDNESYDYDDDADVRRADTELKRMKKKPIKAANIDPDKDKIKRTRRDRKEEDDEIDETFDGQIDEERGFSLVEPLVAKFNTELSGRADIPLTIKEPGSRVWTRGDSTRYRDPGKIVLDQSYIKNWDPKITIRKFWQWVSSQPGMKHGGQISGEFGSDSSEDFVIFKNIYLSFDPNDFPKVTWGSASRYKNKNSVWRHQKPTETREGYDSREAYDKWDPKHPDFVKNWKKFKANNPGATTAEYVAHLRKQPSKIDNESYNKKKVKENDELMYQAYRQFIAEGIAYFIAEDEEGKAKSITAAADMVNDFTSWMQRVGNYQTKSMIELADNIRANFGMQEANAFKQSVGAALEGALTALTQAREEINNAVAVLAGEAPAEEQMGMDDMTSDVGDTGMDASGPDNMNPPSDEFAASDAAAGGLETTGRLRRESIERGNRLMKMLGA